MKVKNYHLTYIHSVAAIRSLANDKSSTSSKSFVSYKWRWTSVIITHASHMDSCQLWWTLLKTTSGLKKHVRRLWPVPLHRLYFVEDFVVDLVLSELDFNFFSELFTTNLRRLWQHRSIHLAFVRSYIWHDHLLYTLYQTFETVWIL